jgi:hypothetical protein
LPNGPGGALNEVEALLIKDTETCIDSFFTFGMPTPDALLAGFGIVQGRSNTRTSYRFFAKGLKSEILSIDRFENAGVVDSDATISTEVDLGSSITLERQDIIAEVDLSIFREYINPDSVYTPNVGANQVWDYTGLPTIGRDTITLEVSNDVTFPNADFVTETQDYLAAGNVGAVFDRSDFYVLNDSTYGVIGSKFGPTNIPLIAITGSDTDSLNSLGSVALYPNDPTYRAWFPMNYRDDIRNSNYIVDNNFLLTVVAFGLDHVPTANKVTGDNSHEVVGWGSLSLTDPMTQLPVQHDAILMKSTSVQVDSFFLGGAPMEEPFLSAFGVTQGSVSISEVYRFYAKGYADAVLTLCNCSESWILAGSEFLPNVAVQDRREQLVSVKYYPNPIIDQLNLEFEKSTNEPWVFSVYNSIGQKVFDHQINQPKGIVNETISFKSQLPAGNYFYALSNEDLTVMSSGGLIMK